MVRTQVQLTEAQARKLRALARQEGVSIAELVRRCVDQMLAAHSPDREARFARAEELIGRFTDPAGATDLAIHHDRYLAASFGERASE